MSKEVRSRSPSSIRCSVRSVERDRKRSGRGVERRNQKVIVMSHWRSSSLKYTPYTNRTPCDGSKSRFEAAFKHYRRLFLRTEDTTEHAYGARVDSVFPHNLASVPPY